MRSRKNRDLLSKIATVLVLVLVWEVLARVRDQPLLFPSLEQIFSVALPSLGIFSESGQPGLWPALGVLCWNAFVSIVRIAIGLGIGIPAGVALGLVVHYLRGSGRASLISLTIVRSIPLLALIPLFAFWFGTSESGIVAYVAFGAFVVASSDTYEAAANVPPVFVQQAKLLGANRVFLFQTVYLPGIQMQLLGGLRNIVGLSWALSLGAEYVSSTSGLGYITYQSYLYSDMGKMAILAFLYVVLGYSSYEIARFVVNRLTPWIVVQEEKNP